MPPTWIGARRPQPAQVLLAVVGRGRVDAAGRLRGDPRRHAAFGLAAAHGRIALEKRGRRAKDRFAYRPERRAQPEAAERTAPSAVADGA